MLCYETTAPPKVGRLVNCPEWAMDDITKVPYDFPSDNCEKDCLGGIIIYDVEGAVVDTPSVPTPPIVDPPVVPSDGSEGGDTPEPTPASDCPEVTGPRRGSVGKNEIYQLALSWGQGRFQVEKLLPTYQSNKGQFMNQWLQFCPCQPDQVEDGSCDLFPNNWDSELRNKLKKYAPSYVKDGDCGAQQQWKQYGVCTGWSPNNYLEKGVDALLSIRGSTEGTPKSIIKAIGKTISLTDLGSPTLGFPFKTGLVCDGTCTLTNAYPCFREVDGILQQIDCPKWALDAEETNSCSVNKCSKVKVSAQPIIHDDL
jgi:hypothetical protein